jgi:hypothetical protein
MSSCQSTFICSSANRRRERLRRSCRFEATRVAAVAAQDSYAYKTTQTSFPHYGSLIAYVLAAALLRFQRVESEEVRREASVYAYESGEEETCGSSQGLALEQFFLLREKRFGVGPHRSHELIPVTRFTSKAPAFKNRRLGHSTCSHTTPPPSTGGRCNAKL